MGMLTATQSTRRTRLDCAPVIHQGPASHVELPSVRRWALLSAPRPQLPVLVSRVEYALWEHLQLSAEVRSSSPRREQEQAPFRKMPTKLLRRCLNGEIS